MSNMCMYSDDFPFGILIVHVCVYAVLVYPL